jgi:hypothetical protein
VPRNPLFDSFKLTGAAALALSAATAEAGDELDADAAPAADNAGFALNAMMRMRVNNVTVWVCLWHETDIQQLETADLEMKPPLANLN